MAAPNDGNTAAFWLFLQGGPPKRNLERVSLLQPGRVADVEDGVRVGQVERGVQQVQLLLLLLLLLPGQVGADEHPLHLHVRRQVQIKNPERRRDGY